MDTIIQKRKAFIINFIYVAIFIGLYYFIMNFAFGYIFPFVFAAALSVFLQRPIKAITKKLHIKAHSAENVFTVALNQCDRMIRTSILILRCSVNYQSR